MRRINGFGLLEVLLSITIIVMVISGIGALSSYSAKTSELNLRRTTAYNLAQEGIEMVRQHRDNNFLASTSWADGLPGTLGTPSINYINIPNAIDNGQRNGITYTRTVTSQSLATAPDGNAGGEYRLIISSVTWQEYGRTWSVEAKTLLTNWKAL